MKAFLAHANFFCKQTTQHPPGVPNKASLENHTCQPHRTQNVHIRTIIFRKSFRSKYFCSAKKKIFSLHVAKTTQAYIAFSLWHLLRVLAKMHNQITKLKRRRSKSRRNKATNSSPFEFVSHLVTALLPKEKCQNFLPKQMNLVQFWARY